MAFISFFRDLEIGLNMEEYIWHWSIEVICLDVGDSRGRKRYGSFPAESEPGLPCPITSF